MRIPLIEKALEKIEATRPFKENEAWVLFRAAALGEAVGWTLLITGIAIQRYHLAGSHYAVPIAGQIHGTLFICYFGVILATYSSLRWHRFKFLVAAAAGVVPYGTLAFELWASHDRRRLRRRQHFYSIVLSVLPLLPSQDISRSVAD